MSYLTDSDRIKKTQAIEHELFSTIENLHRLRNRFLYFCKTNQELKSVHKQMKEFDKKVDGLITQYAYYPALHPKEGKTLEAI